MARKILFLTGLVIVIATLAFLWRDRRELQDMGHVKAPEPRLPRKEVADAPPAKQEDAVARDVISGALNLAWQPMEQGRGDRPDYQRADVFRRLQPARVVRSRETVLNDRRVLEHLLETKGKYPMVILQQTWPLHPGAGEASIHEVAYVANHVLLRPSAARTLEQVEAVLAAQGHASSRVGSTGILRVQLPGADFDEVGRALAKFEKSGLGIMEPDGLLFSTDVLDAWEVNGEDRVFDEERLDWKPQSTGMHDGISPAFYGADVNLAAAAERVNSLPPGARVLGFDLPHFRKVTVSTADTSYTPSLLEQNFILSVPGYNMYIQNAISSGSAHNGTNYAIFSIGHTGFTVTHKDGLTFAAYSVDLSEYHTNFTAPVSITFRGTKADTSTVTQTFTTDGVIDGTGSTADFQTFTFNSSFTELVKLEVTSSPIFTIDNIVVAPNGQETPLPAPPEAPLVYDINWDGDPHVVDQPTVLAGPYSPTSANFGTQYVRQSVGALTQRPLEFRPDPGQGYDQFRLDLGYGSTNYVMEFDVTMPTPRQLAVFFDANMGFYRVDFNANGTVILLEHTGVSGSSYPASQNFTPAAVTRVRFEMHFPERIFRLLLNGTQVLSRPLMAVVSEVKAARFNVSDNVSNPGRVGLDNLKVWADIATTLPPSTPEVRLWPESLNYASLSVGGSYKKQFRVYNDGTADLVLSSITSTNPGEFRIDETVPRTIIPGSSHDIAVTFVPAQAGARTGAIIIQTNDSDEGALNIPLTGTGYSAPVAQLTPSVLYVTMLSNQVGTRSFTISNSGGADLHWNFEKGEGATSLAPVNSNDPQYNQQWALRPPTNSLGGIDAPHAWTSTTGQNSVKVAVIDTGVDTVHPDLAANIWTNAAEIPNNGIDDDGNGYVDDRQGWNFANDNNQPADGHGHGTHVAGTIAARGNNGVGITGVAWVAAIVPIKFLNDQGSGATSDAIQAVDYARKVGVRVINASWGGGGESALLQSAIQNFISQRDGVFVAAAGNNYENADVFPMYPAAFPNAGILSVAASSATDQLASFSNYGSTSVDLAAPGTGILSTLPGNRQGTSSGTSMAAPHVSGTLALLLAQRSSYGGGELRRLILAGVDERPDLGGRVATDGRLNASRAVGRVVVPWIVPALLSGTVAPGDSTQVALSLNTASLTPGRYVQSLVLNTNDPAKPKINLPVDLTVSSTNGYGSWAHNHFVGAEGMLSNETASTLWGGSADADHDGQTNLLEFITGSDPVSNDERIVPEIRLENGKPVFFFETLASLDGALWNVEWSGSLGSSSWTPSGLQVVLDQNLPGVGRKRWKASFINAAAAPALAFFRLSMSAQ